jgi:hypothetical protein
LLRWLAWTLVVAAVISAVVQLLLTFGIWAGGPTEPPETADLLTKLETWRGNDGEILGAVIVGSLASMVVYLLVGLIGVVMRGYADGGAARDVMATVLVMGGVVGIVSQLLNIGVSAAATFGICDCGYRTEELISQDHALTIGWVTIGWFYVVAVMIVGLGTALAGRLVPVSSTWRMLSYAIALILIVAGVVRMLAYVMQLPFDAFMTTDVAIGLTAAILVPIWAVMLSRGLRTRDAVSA